LDLTHPATQVVGDSHELLEQLAGIAKGLGVRAAGAKGLVHKTKATDTQKDLGQVLKSAGKAAVLLGNLAATSPRYTVLKGLAHAIAEAAGATFGFLPAAANSTGAALAGALPHVSAGAKAAERTGVDARGLLAEPRRAYVLMGFEPALDTWDPSASARTLGKADFVAALSPWRSPSLEAVADVILPVGDFGETAGTYVNGEGRWQSFQGAIAPPGEARPAWKVLRVLGNLLDLQGFDYGSARQIREELQGLCEEARPDNGPRGELLGSASQAVEGALERIGDVPIYAVDSLTRRAAALQKTRDAIAFGVWIGPAQAERMGLADGDKVAVRQSDAKVEARVIVDRRIPDGCARIPAGLSEAERLGAACGPVILEKV
jgi:NADH-quinone oxidoreductase subunit G